MSRSTPATSAWRLLLAWKVIYSLGCRFCLWCRRRDFPVSPNSSILKILLFPDRHGALQHINGKPAGIKCRRPVRRADRNTDACFADVQPSEAMHHGDPVYGKSFVDLRANLAHFGQRHGFVSFIFKVFCGPAVRFVADETIERDDGAILPCAYMPHKRRRIDGRLNKLIKIAFGRRGHWYWGSASADRGKKGDLIPACNPRVPGDELLIARRNQRGAKPCELRVALDVTLQKFAECRPFGDFSAFFREAGEFTDAAEEEDFYPDIGRDGWHRKIVT